MTDPTHLTPDEKAALVIEFTRAISNAVLPILEHSTTKGICPHCVSRCLVGALAERTGSLAGTASFGSKNPDQEQFTVGVLVAGSFALQLKKEQAHAEPTEATDDELAAMPVEGRPS
jgi:hypothetical protein